MDKRTLTREELRMLRHFIASRSSGFAEPSVLLEIMDHFACKTEELLVADPSLSFEEAMKKAHLSFGVKGFAPLAEAHRKGLTSRYRRLYRQEYRKILGSYHLAGLLIAGFFVYQLYLSGPHWFGAATDSSYIILLMEMLYAICIFVGRRRIAVHQDYRLFYDKCIEASSGAIVAVWAGLPLIILQQEISRDVMAVFTGMLAFVLLLNLLVVKKLFDSAEKDTLETRQQLEQIV